MKILSLSIFCLVVIEVTSVSFQDIRTEDDLIKGFNVYYEILDFKPITTLDNTPIVKDVTFWCANKVNPEFQLVLDNDDDISAILMSNKKTVFIIHGWNSNWKAIKDIGDEMLKYFDINVCCVDYARLAKFEYSIAVRTLAPKIGIYIASFIRQMDKIEIDLNSITIIGHSLGAHIAGYTGSSLDGQIAQIVGLDPAGPLFTFPVLMDASKRLDESDAKFVQTILTDKNQLGTGISLGHQNFYPNNGENPQPKCEIYMIMFGLDHLVTMSCSHSFSVTLFKFSLDPGLTFLARKCDSYQNYLNNKCKLTKNSSDRLGIYSQKIYGDFYLLTSGEEPYMSRENYVH